jgi:dipeptidyl-peptidase-4
VHLNHGRTEFIDTHQSLSKPPSMVLRSLEDGSEVAVIHQPDDPRLEALNLPSAALFTFQTRDGVTLDGALYRPSGDGPFPLLVHVYGGPHALMVTNSWGVTADMRDQWLASRGWLVARIDNRGANGRGLAFEGALRWNMGDIEVRDQVDGVRHLVQQGLADPARVGIYGWSYGGYMSIMALLREPDTFKAGVAGAPVTHWDGYDTHYTERYMGTPHTNPEGYRVSSAMAHADKLQGKLLLVHGMIDENVHFRHTARFVNSLVKAGKRYELLAFPDERHAPRDDAGRIYMEETLVEFFERNL